MSGPPTLRVTSRPELLVVPLRLRRVEAGELGLRDPLQLDRDLRRLVTRRPCGRQTDYRQRRHLPAALASRGAAMGKGFAGSLTMGAGQFCTNPGLVFAVEGPGLEEFIAGAKEALTTCPASTMLTPGIHAAYQKGVTKLQASPRLTEVARGMGARPGSFEGQSVLFATDAPGFKSDPVVQEEVFGAASVIVRCPDVADHAQSC